MSTFINSMGYSEVAPEYLATTGKVTVHLKRGYILMFTSGGGDNQKHFWYLMTPMYDKCIEAGAKIDLQNALLFFDDEETAVLFKLTHL